MVSAKPKKYNLVFSCLVNQEKYDVKKSISFLVNAEEQKLNNIEDLFKKYFKIIKNCLLKENAKALMKVHFEMTEGRFIPKAGTMIKKTTRKKNILQFDYKQDEDYILETHRKLLKFKELFSKDNFVLVFNILANTETNHRFIKYELSIRVEYEKSEVF
jgi:hypothetical protein